MQLVAVEDAHDLVVAEHEEQREGAAQELQVGQRRREEPRPRGVVARDVQDDPEIDPDLAEAGHEMIGTHDRASLYWSNRKPMRT